MDEDGVNVRDIIYAALHNNVEKVLFQDEDWFMVEISPGFPNFGRTRERALAFALQEQAERLLSGELIFGHMVEKPAECSLLDKH